MRPAVSLTELTKITSTGDDKRMARVECTRGNRTGAPKCSLRRVEVARPLRDDRQIVEGIGQFGMSWTKLSFLSVGQRAEVMRGRRGIAGSGRGLGTLGEQTASMEHRSMSGGDDELISQDKPCCVGQASRRARKGLVEHHRDFQFLAHTDRLVDRVSSGGLARSTSRSDPELARP